MLKDLPEPECCVAVVGHNPAITQAVNYLAGTDISNVPTASIIALECPVEHWAALDGAICKLDYFDAPKSFR